jgi:hypothetical protein
MRRVLRRKKHRAPRFRFLISPPVVAWMVSGCGFTNAQATIWLMRKSVGYVPETRSSALEGFLVAEGVP